MVGFPAARLTDLHICPMVTGIVPHVGGPVIGPCAPTVIISGLPAARVTDMCTCVGPPDMIAKGSATVITFGMPQARIIVDPTIHGGMIVVGAWTVLVGDVGGGGGGGGGAGAAAAPGAGTGGPAAELLAKIMNGQSNLKVEGTPEFQAKTMVSLAKLANTPTGLGLLQSLDSAPHTTTIKETSNGNEVTDTAYMPPGPTGLLPKAFRNDDGTAGAGGDHVVLFNPDKKSIGSEPWQTRDPAIGLGHELVHADHAARGTNDKGASDYTGLDGNTYNDNKREQQAVGLGPYADDPYTENKMRKEFDEKYGGHPPRPHY